MARLTSEHVTELRRIHAQCRATLAFLYDQGILQVGRVEGETGLDQSLTMQNLRGMRMALRDLQGLVRDLPADTRRALDEVVIAASGASLYADAPATAAKLDAIMERGRIRNEREYHVVRARFDELEGHAGHDGELTKLRNLLAAFDASGLAT